MLDILRGVVGTALAACLVAPAAALEPRFHFKAGYDTGGDTLVTAVFTGGDTESIKANDGFFFGAGVSLLNDAGDVETEIALSYKFDEITASNGTITFSSLPLDVLVFHRLPAVRLGGGVTYHLSPEVEGSGVASGFGIGFKDALGFVLRPTGA